jgi:hypothetical protein
VLATSLPADTMNHQPLAAQARLLPPPLPLGEVRVRVRSMGEDRGEGAAGLGAGGLARNVAEILEV